MALLWPSRAQSVSISQNSSQIDQVVQSLITAAPVASYTPLVGESLADKAIREEHERLAAVVGDNPYKKMAYPMVVAAFGPSEWAAFDWLVTKESSWNPQAKNPNSSACGLMQAITCPQMDAIGYDYRTNPHTQIEWGIGYLRSVHQTPSQARTHHLQKGWY